MKTFIAILLLATSSVSLAEYKITQVGTCLVRTQLGMFPMQCVRFTVDDRTFTNIIHPKGHVIGTNETIDGQQVQVDQQMVKDLVLKSQGTAI